MSECEQYIKELRLCRVLFAGILSAMARIAKKPASSQPGSDEEGQSQGLEEVLREGRINDPELASIAIGMKEFGERLDRLLLDAETTK